MRQRSAELIGADSTFWTVREAAHADTGKILNTVGSPTLGEVVSGWYPGGFFGFAQNGLNLLIRLVGAAGFEPTTPSPPD